MAAKHRKGINGIEAMDLAIAYSDVNHRLARYDLDQDIRDGFRAASSAILGWIHAGAESRLTAEKRRDMEHWLLNRRLATDAVLESFRVERAAKAVA